MADGTLKSFLVDLGFRIDQATLARWYATIQQASNTVNQLAARLLQQGAALNQVTTAQRTNTAATAAGTQATTQATGAGTRQVGVLHQLLAAVQANTAATAAGTQATTQATGAGAQHLGLLRQIATGIQHLTTQMHSNQQTQRRMQQAAHATGVSWDILKKATVGMVGAISGMGWAVERSMRQVNDSFDNLFYMAQRTGVAVGKLQDVIFANKQVGIGADQTKSA